MTPDGIILVDPLGRETAFWLGGEAEPGENLREDTMPTLRLSVTNAASQLGVARQTLHRVFAGKAA